MKILFWNVWCLPLLFTDGKYTSDKRARLICPYLAGYDLVLLCEAWTSDAKEVFLAETIDEYPYRYTDHNASPLGFGTGLIVLSKHPFGDGVTQHLYSKNADFDWFSHKGVFGFQIQYPTSTGARPLTFFFTHMQATYNSSWPIFNYTSASQTARLYQTVELIRFVNTVMENNKSSDVWLLGDFNMYSSNTVPMIPVDQYEDNTMRIGCYDMLVKNTRFVDLQTNGSDVYRFFTRSKDPTTITYGDSHGLSDGPNVILDICLSGDVPTSTKGGVHLDKKSRLSSKHFSWDIVALLGVLEGTHDAW